jgi:hypothetical protein
VIDVEVSLNNRPLSYVEDDVQLPLLTPNSMLTINPNHLPELKAYHVDEADLRKRAKHVKKCKEAVWNRWTREYIRSLREQHRRAGGEQTPRAVARRFKQGGCECKICRQLVFRGGVTPPHPPIRDGPANTIPERRRRSDHQERKEKP